MENPPFHAPGDTERPRQNQVQARSQHRDRAAELLIDRSLVQRQRHETGEPPRQQRQQQTDREERPADKTERPASRKIDPPLLRDRLIDRRETRQAQSNAGRHRAGGRGTRDRGRGRWQEQGSHAAQNEFRGQQQNQRSESGNQQSGNRKGASFQHQRQPQPDLHQQDRSQ